MFEQPTVEKGSCLNIYERFVIATCADRNLGMPPWDPRALYKRFCMCRYPHSEVSTVDIWYSRNGSFPFGYDRCAPASTCAAEICAHVYACV